MTIKQVQALDIRFSKMLSDRYGDHSSDDQPMWGIFFSEEVGEVVQLMLFEVQAALNEAEGK